MKPDPFFRAFVTPAIEAALLSLKVRRGRVGRFGFQIFVHTLVRTVVLGVRNAGKLDLNTLLDPPDTELRKSSQAVGGERRAVVDSNYLRHTVVAHHRFERRQSGFKLLIWLGVAADYVVAKTVANGERIAALSVA